MRISSVPHWALAILVGLSFAGCTPHKETANRYKYLIHETPEDNVATKTKSENDLIKEKAMSMNIGERLVPVLTEAKDYLGTPYQYGGKSKSGIDCSGLTMVCYEKAGVLLPRSAADQSHYGEQIARDALQVGDLVFFDAKGKGKIDHVGMITKSEGVEVIFIHSSTSKGVRYDYLNEGYWADKLVDARRVKL
jgi:cell wall-associated NlpC family hydrolase